MDPLPNCGGRVDFLDTEAFDPLLLRYRPDRNYRIEAEVEHNRCDAKEICA